MPSSDFRSKVEPYYTAVGRLALAWAEYEMYVNTMIWELANVERKAGTCMTSQMIGPGPRFRCLVALLHLRNAPRSIINDFNSHHTEAESIGRQRNRFLHDPLVMNSETGQLARMEVTADKHIKHDFIPTEMAELDDLERKVRELIKSLFALHDRVSTEVPPWPRTQFALSDGIGRGRTGVGGKSGD